ncbi:uncharacterized protein LOC144596126 [Rhinoraja longicauda]
MAMAACSDLQLLSVIKDLQISVQELSQGQQRDQRPVTDTNPALQCLCTRLEFLLQYDQKERKSILGVRKDYWDYFCVCLTSHRCGMDALKFVHGKQKLTTSLGRGRAFLRCCLEGQQLADVLQYSFLDQRRASDWYYARSPFLSDGLRWDIIDHLYTLNELTFELPLVNVDLDTSWPKTSCKLSTCTRSRTGPSKRPVKRLSKIARQDPVVDGGSGHQGGREGNGMDADGRPPGEAESANVSDNDGPLTAGPTLAPATSAQQQGLGQQEERRAEWPQVQALLGSHVGGQGKDPEIKDPAVGGQGEADGDQGPRLERLKMDLHRKEDIIEELAGRLTEMEKVKVEECSRLQREVATLREMQTEGLRLLVQLEDSNKFLNETVEEMDVVVVYLRRALTAMEQENASLRRELAGKAAPAQRDPLEEMEEQRPELSGQRELLGQTGQVGSQDAKGSTSRLVQSGDERPAEGRSPRGLGLLEDKGPEQGGDLELPTHSPWPEVIGLRASEGQSRNAALPPMEASGGLNGGVRVPRMERGVLRQPVAREKTPPLEQQAHRAQENVANLTQHLTRCKECQPGPGERVGADLRDSRELLEDLVPALESTDDGKAETELEMGEGEEDFGQVRKGRGGRTVEGDDDGRQIHVEVGTAAPTPSAAGNEEAGRGGEDRSEKGDARPEGAAVHSAQDGPSSREVARVQEWMKQMELRHGQKVGWLEQRLASLETERQRLEDQREVLEDKVVGLEGQLLRRSGEQSEAEGAITGEPAGSAAPTNAGHQETATAPQVPSYSQRSAGDREKGPVNRDTELLALTTALAQAGCVERALRAEVRRASEDVERGEAERRELQLMVASLKERTVQLIREKDELWQRSVQLDSPPHPRPDTPPHRHRLGLHSSWRL